MDNTIKIRYFEYATLCCTDKKIDSFSGKTSITLKLSDYSIDIPKFSGITVAENVEIEVKFSAKISLTQ